MKRMAKAIAVSAAMITAVSVPVASASAHGYHHHHFRSHHHHHHHSRGNAAAAGVIGLAAGAILGSTLARPSPPQVIYQAPPPPPRPYPVYGRIDPWSPGWYQYCRSRFRSFNPQTGTYRGYDGRDHFCNAP